MSKEQSANRYKKLEKKNNHKLAATRHINFGVAIFMMIFAYLLFVMITFAMKDKVNYTIAETGVLTHSNIYNGLVIKKESVVTAKDEGDIRYYFTEGSRVRSNNTVATIIKDSETARLLDEDIFRLNQTLHADDPAFDESYEYLQGRIKNYVINQHNHKFNKTYSIKREIVNDIDNIRSTVITQQSSMGLLTSANIITMEESLEEIGSPLLAPSSGLVSFNIDGMEDIWVDDFSTIAFTRQPVEQELSTRRTANVDEEMFKVVDNYLWYIAAEIDDECEKQIEGKSYINIEFLDKDLSLDVKINGKDAIWDEGNKTYLIVQVDRMLGEFINDRYLDFRIVYDEYEGIKVPETAVTTKEFVSIPANYLTIINNEYSVHKKVFSEDAVGGVTVEGIRLKQIKREDEAVLIPLSDQLQVGDTISYTDNETLQTYELILTDTVELQGVYVVNKGYAMFKFIETRYRETDYRIVEPFIPYGVRMYDRIATEGELTKEYQIIN